MSKETVLREALRPDQMEAGKRYQFTGDRTVYTKLNNGSIRRVDLRPKVGKKERRRLREASRALAEAGKNRRA